MLLIKRRTTFLKLTNLIKTMKKFQYLSQETDIKIIGRYFIQTLGIPSAYDYNIYAGENGVQNINNNYYPNENVLFEWEMKVKAKLTDAVTVSNNEAIGFFVNDKLRSIFKRFDLCNVRWYEGELILSNGSRLSYWWLHPIFMDLRLLDWEQSTFCKGEFYTGRQGDILTFNNSDEYLAYKFESYYLHPIEIHFANNITIPDLFLLPRSPYLIASMDLIAELNEQKIKGLMAEPFFT